MLIRCIDFETTGRAGDDDPLQDEIVEVGWQDVVLPAAALGEGCGALLVNPGRPVTPQARGVHHIADDELAGAVDRKAAIVELCMRHGLPYAFAAHEARHERSLWSTNKRPWICTRKAALRVWPDAPDYKLQTLRYWLGLPCDAARASPPHRAMPDAYVGAVLLIRLLAETTPEQMFEWTEQPSLLPICPLKKHKGARWEAVPDDYLRWMLDQSDMDEDLRFTARHYLQARQPTKAW